MYFTINYTRMQGLRYFTILSVAFKKYKVHLVSVPPKESFGQVCTQTM
ncbi:MAG: hypothetical protein M3Z92_16305 [Bacteroidota bacterium]|nr:hypothetical protein [Bacteroidota bacterium]